MQKINSRIVAFKILNRYNPGTSNLSLLIDKFVNKRYRYLDNIGFVRDIVWGVVRYLNTIDYIINKLSYKKSEKIQKDVRNILRIGIYQILFSKDRIPEYAAVNETVKLVSMIRYHKASGFVNAILRSLVRSKNSIDYSDSNLIKEISIKYSHPQWLIERWLKRYSKQEIISLCIANNTDAKINIRVNTLNITKEKLLKILNSQDIIVVPLKYSPCGLALISKPHIEIMESYNKGLFVIQDEASQLIPYILSPKSGEVIIDLCCGSGIKTLQIAEMVRGNAKIIGFDISEKQIKRAKENAKRLGVKNINWKNEDALSIKNMNFCDKVLLDAPCSGIGVIRRKPDIKWNQSEDLIRNHYSFIQRHLLDKAAEIVKPGGIIVYSTCSVEPEETNDVICDFLKTHSNFMLDNLELPDTAQSLLNNNRKIFTTYPHIHGTDGFFAVRIKKLYD